MCEGEEGEVDVCAALGSALSREDDEHEALERRHQVAVRQHHSLRGGEESGPVVQFNRL